MGQSNAERPLIGPGGVIALGIVLVGIITVLTVVDQFVGAPRVIGGLAARAGGAGAAAGRTVQGVAQSAGDVFDPAHPPRGALVYDTELDELRRVGHDDPIASHPERDLTLIEVRKRPAAETAETAQYAVVSDRLAVPRETRVVGVVVARTFEPREHILYKGQLFRVGRSIYKVNWLSYDSQQVAVARLRSADAQTGDLAFAID